MSAYTKSPIPLIMMGIYILAVVFLSYKASFTKKIREKRKKETFEEYYTGGKSMSGVVVALITIVTFYSGTTFTGRVGFFYNYGVVSLTSILACSMVGVIMFFLSEKIWPISKKYRLSTLSDMLELRYQTKWIKLLVAITIVCFNMIWLVTEIRTLGLATSIASGGNIPVKVGSVIAFTIIILYVMTGGVRSVAAVDSFSAVVMLVGSVITFGYIIAYFYDGSIGGMFAAAVAAKPEIMTINSGVKFNMPYWISNLFLGTVVMLVYPSNYMSICLANSTKAVKKASMATSVSGLWLSIYGLLGIAALGAAGTGFKVADPQSSVLEMLSFSGSAVLLGLVATFILAASLGTLDSTLISLSGLLSNDVITNAQRIKENEPCIGENGDEASVITSRVTKNAKQEIFRTRVIVVILGVIAMCISMTNLPLLVIMVNHATNGLCQIVPAVVGGLYWRKATPQAAISSLVGGVIAYLIINNFAAKMGLTFGGLMLGIPALVLSITIFVVVSLCTYKKYYAEHTKCQGIYDDFFVKKRVEQYIKENFSI